MVADISTAADLAVTVDGQAWTVDTDFELAPLDADGWAECKPVLTPSRNGELQESARSSGRKLRSRLQKL